MSRVARGTPAGDAYLDLQNQARGSGRPTQELLQLYVLEGFLARLAVSEVCGSFVLKGGVLLAALAPGGPPGTSTSLVSASPTTLRRCWNWCVPS